VDEEEESPALSLEEDELASPCVDISDPKRRKRKTRRRGFMAFPRQR
jgi:hypothetical protein